MTSPTPFIPNLQEVVGDLARRVRTLEGGGGRRGVTADSVGAFPATPAQWPSTTATDWTQLWLWNSRLEWSSLDLRIQQQFSAGGITATLRVIMDDSATVWTSEDQGPWTHDGLADLTELTTDGSGDSPHQFAIEGKITSGTGTLYVWPQRLMMVDPL